MFDRISDSHKPQNTNTHKRPMSAVTRLTSASRMSNVPDIGRMKMMLIANDVYRNRQAISEAILGGKV